MVFLYFDSENPLDCFDNPNCFFNDEGIGCRREESDPGYVLWFPPGYSPPKPEPKHKRRTPTLTAAINPQPSTPMSFQFIIVPNPKNPARPFRSRPAYGEQVTEAQFLDDVAADSTVSRADIEKVLTSACKVTVGYMRQTRSLAHVLGLFRAMPTMGGSYTTNAPSADEVKAGVGFSLIVGPEALAAMLDGLTVEKVDEVGTIKPEIENLTLSPGGTPNAYSLTAAIKGSGDHFRGSGPNQPWPTAFLTNEDGTSPIAVPVFTCSQTEILIGPPPAGTTGIKRLKLVAGWDDDIEFIYPVPLTLV